jgi:hypothetical protein
MAVTDAPLCDFSKAVRPCAFRGAMCEAPLTCSRSLFSAAAACNNLGFLLEGEGREEEAEGLYRRAIGINPTHVTVSSTPSVHAPCHSSFYSCRWLGA